MRMRENVMSIGKVFNSDETLLRLLYYKASNFNDSPLSPSKPDILSLPNKWDIIGQRIVSTQKVEDLSTNQICRILFYPGRRWKTEKYLVADQEIVIDVLCHVTYDQMDYRLSWICDRVAELMFDERITGLNKMRYKEGGSITAPNGYIGYRLTYSFGSVN